MHPLKCIEICLSLKASCNSLYSIELKFLAHVTGMWDYPGKKFGDYWMSSGNNRAKICGLMRLVDLILALIIPPTHLMITKFFFKGSPICL